MSKTEKGIIAATIIIIILLVAATYALFNATGFYKGAVDYSFNIPQKFNATHIRFTVMRIHNLFNDLFDGENTYQPLPFVIYGKAANNTEIRFRIEYFNGQHSGIIGDNIKVMPDYEKLGESDYTIKVLSPKQVPGDIFLQIAMILMSSVIWSLVVVFVAVYLFGFLWIGE